jgi:hypothetical protein
VLVPARPCRRVLARRSRGGAAARDGLFSFRAGRQEFAVGIRPAQPLGFDTSEAASPELQLQSQQRASQLAVCSPLDLLATAVAKRKYSILLRLKRIEPTVFRHLHQILVDLHLRALVRKQQGATKADSGIACILPCGFNSPDAASR